MKNWLDSIYSDGTLGFVSDTNPEAGDEITVRLRLFEAACIDKIFLRRIRNGAEEYIEMNREKSAMGLAYYTAKVDINEPVIRYYFVISCGDIIYFYTQAGVTTFVPDEKSDFVILSKAAYRQPSWVKGAVFYQIFPTSFRNHSLMGIVEKIPYLKKLGVNVIYLNPIFRAKSEHKYDCKDYFHVDESLGGDAALEELSKALHDNGMRIILDISINHTGLDHSWVEDKRYFYLEDKDGTLKGWAGFKGLPVLDYRHEEVRDLIYRNEDSVLKKWLKPPYNIDGWRFDVADVFGRNDDLQLADELWREVCASIREVNPEAMIIGEHWADCTEFLQGDLWNCPMNYFGYGRIVRQFAGLKDLFLERNETLREVKYLMNAGDVVGRTNEFYRYIPQIVADCSMNLYDSHDVSRVHNNAGISFDKWRMVAMSQLLWTGIPCIYYGDELGIDGYTENDLGFRLPMPWDRADDEEGNEYFKLYRRIIDLRKNESAFSEGGRKVLYSDGRILAISRFMDDNIYVGIMSMEDEEKTIGFPIDVIGGTGFEGAGSDGGCDVFGRKYRGRVTLDGEAEITVPSHETYLIKLRSR